MAIPASSKQFTTTKTQNKNQLRFYQHHSVEDLPKSSFQSRSGFNSDVFMLKYHKNKLTRCAENCVRECCSFTRKYSFQLVIAFAAFFLPALYHRQASASSNCSVSNKRRAQAVFMINSTSLNRVIDTEKCHLKLDDHFSNAVGNNSCAFRLRICLTKSL